MKYKVTIPYQHDTGSISPITATETRMESAYNNALWQYNCMRRHDQLPERKTLPKGTTFEPVEERGQ